MLKLKNKNFQVIFLLIFSILASQHHGRSVVNYFSANQIAQKLARRQQASVAGRKNPQPAFPRHVVRVFQLARVGQVVEGAAHRPVLRNANGQVFVVVGRVDEQVQLLVARHRLAPRRSLLQLH